MAKNCDLKLWIILENWYDVNVASDLLKNFIFVKTSAPSENQIEDLQLTSYHANHCTIEAAGESGHYNF